MDVDECSSAYDPCVWDLLQAIVNHISDGHTSEFPSTIDSYLPNENVNKAKSSQETILDKIDTLLCELNEPNYPIEHNKVNNDGLAILLAAADSCLANEDTSRSSTQIS